MTDIAQLGIQVNSAPAVKAAGDLDKLAISAGKADAAADRLAANTGKVAPAMAGAGQGSRMLAMQLSQVAQQASATGNFVQALAIQLPDMAMGFGAVGIAAGVVASVALPAVVSMMMSSTSAAQQLQGVLSEMDDAVSNFAGAVAAASAPTEELVQKYGMLADVAQRALDAMAAVDRVEAISAVNAAISEALGLITEIGRINARDQGQLFLVDSFGLAADEVQRLTEAIRALDSAQGLEAQAIAADRVQQELMQAYGSVEAMPSPIQAVYRGLAQAASSAAEVSGATDASALSADRLTQRMADAYGMYAATRNMAAELAGETERAASAAFALAQQQIAAAGKTYSGRGGDPRTSNQQGYGEFSYSGPALDQNNNVIPSRGGGGGGGVDQYAQQLAALTESLQSERQILDQWYAESQTILADRRAMEILGEQGHKDAMLAIEQEYQQRLAEVQGNSQQQRLTDTASFFGSLAGIMQAGGDRTAKITATFAAIEGTINAYAAAIDAARKAPTIAGKFAAYASVLATGLKGVAAIRAAGGVSGGGGSRAIAAQGSGTGTTSTTEFIVKGLDKNALYSGEQLSMIFDGFLEEAQKRGLNTRVSFI